MQGPLLLKNLREALDMAKRCEEVCEDFEKHRPPEVIHDWKMLKRRWELDPSQPDPFVLVEKGTTVVRVILPIYSYLLWVLAASRFNTAKLKLLEIEAQEVKSSGVLPHMLTPSSFVRMGLELEDHQCAP